MFEASGGEAVRRRVMVGPPPNPKKEGPTPAALDLPRGSVAQPPKKPLLKNTSCRDHKLQASSAAPAGFVACPTKATEKKEPPVTCVAEGSVAWR